jgi:hypothetical protein
VNDADINTRCHTERPRLAGCLALILLVASACSGQGGGNEVSPSPNPVVKMRMSLVLLGVAPEGSYRECISEAYWRGLPGRDALEMCAQDFNQLSLGTPSPLNLSTPWGGYSSAVGSGEAGCAGPSGVDPEIAYTERAPTEQEIKDNNLDPRQSVIVYGAGEEERYQGKLDADAKSANDALHQTAEWQVYQDNLNATIDNPNDAQAEERFQESLKGLTETPAYQAKTEAEKKAADGPPKFTVPRVNNVDPDAQNTCEAMAEMTRVCNSYGWDSPECLEYGGAKHQPDCGDPAPDSVVLGSSGPYPCGGELMLPGGEDAIKIALLHCQIYGGDPETAATPCQETAISGEARTYALKRPGECDPTHADMGCPTVTVVNFEFPNLLPVKTLPAALAAMLGPTFIAHGGFLVVPTAPSVGPPPRDLKPPF